MRKSMVLVALGTAWLATAPASIRAQAMTVADGAQVYAEACGRCHNPRSPSEYSSGGWNVVVTHMRTRANLTGQDSRAVLYFLQASDQSTARPVIADTGLVERGKALVDQSGCMACHKVGDYTTGTIGPDLNTVLSRRSSEYILQKLANPKFDNPSSVMPQLNLSELDRDAILAYLTSIAQK